MIQIKRIDRKSEVLVCLICSIFQRRPADEYVTALGRSTHEHMQLKCCPSSQEISTRFHHLAYANRFRSKGRQHILKLRFYS